MSDIDRIPPQSLEMEQATLGAMLLDRSAIEQAAMLVRREDFYRTAHQYIFQAMLTLVQRDEPVDMLTVQNQLKLEEVLESVGGAPYLYALMDMTATPSNVGHYAKIVSDKAYLRRLMEVGRSFIALAHSEYESIDSVASQAEMVYTNATSRISTVDPKPLNYLVSQAFEQIEEWSETKRHVIGIPTGITELDFLLSGIQPRKLYVIAARPGMGKSALAGQIAMSAARQGVKTLLASLEMGDMEFVHRMIATESSIDANQIASGYFTDEMWRSVGYACAKLSKFPMWIDDESDSTIDRLRLLARRYARDGLGLMIVDYLQLVRTEDAREGRTREIDVIAHALKGIAKSLKIPVIALSQLNRKVDDRPNHRPTLGDLRESGGIEAAADVVIYPYNPAHYGDPSERKDFETVELIVAKARGAKLGVARAGWQRRTTEFVNIAKEYRSDDTTTRPEVIHSNGTKPTVVATNPMEEWNPPVNTRGAE